MKEHTWMRSAILVFWTLFWGLSVVDKIILAEKLVWERTVNAFTAAHPELEVTYIYTGPSELNTKKKTHLLLYVFTEPNQDH